MRTKRSDTCEERPFIDCGEVKEDEEQRGDFDVVN